MASAEVRPFWLVLDVRAASSDQHSGLARFVIGLSKALGQSLLRRREEKDPLTRQVKLLLVAKSEPPEWAVELIQEYPGLVSFWSGGPGALSDAWDKPQYLWSSRVLKWILRWSGGRFFWVAPGNFDRPLLSSVILPRALRAHIVQVIHDTIPLDHARSMGLFFRLQFSVLVRRTLARLPYVFTVSEDSVAKLAKLSPKRTSSIHLLPNGIEPVFGTLPRCRTASEFDAVRRFLLQKLSFVSGEGADSDGNILSAEALDALIKKRWVVGVGRSQKYKGWITAEEAVRQLNGDLSEGVLFIRVGGDEDGASKAVKATTKNAQFASAAVAACPTFILRSSGGFESAQIESLPDELLAQLYRCCDLLVHPSKAEGFGFPPVEAALSGVPVIFRTGTAVDGHFKGHSFHADFWRGLNSDDPAEWRTAILSILRNKNGLEQFFDEMQMAVHPRSFICQRGGGQDFRWEHAAENLLNTLFQKQSEDQAAAEGQHS